jgi:predicted metal-dependent HD superfamily phosphohydrolase
MLKEEFIKAVNSYSTDPKKGVRMWNEIESYYSNKKRFYHNLTHLENLLRELNNYSKEFSNWDTVVFAIAYHDIVYDVLRSDNEEKSADLAVDRLSSISFPSEAIEKCKELILATKSHEKKNKEADLFTDADLSILGSTGKIYREYADQIRKEYYPYKNSDYNPGRIKVLEHFLQMPRIFKTDIFAATYEKQARKNLSDEIEFLKTPFSDLLRISKELKEELEKRKSEPFISDYDDILSQLVSYLPALQKMELWPAESLSNHFWAGSWLQDTAISSGWGEKFLELAKRFDPVYEYLQSKPSVGEKKEITINENPVSVSEAKSLIEKFNWDWDNGPYKCYTIVYVYEDELYWKEEQTPQFHDGESWERKQTMKEFFEKGPPMGPPDLKSTEMGMEFYLLMESLNK